MSAREFTVNTPRTFREGYGVAVVPIYAGEDDDQPDRITDIDVSVVRIAADTTQIVGGVPCVALPSWGSMFYPLDNFRELEPLTVDDSHDLRDQWFATEREATEHAESVQKQWANPLPWQSFCVTS